MNGTLKAFFKQQDSQPADQLQHLEFPTPVTSTAKSQPQTQTDMKSIAQRVGGPVLMSPPS